MGLDFSKEAARPPLSIACVAELSHGRFVAIAEIIGSFRSGDVSPMHRHSTSRVLFEPAGANNDTHEGQDPSTLLSWRAYDLTLSNFEVALDFCNISDEDRLVIERVFTLMDRSGDEVVHSLELLVAMSLLIPGPFTTKLEYAVHCLVEDLHDKPLSAMHLMFLLSTMTTVANYFGDPLLPLPVLQGIAEDVFDELSCSPDFDLHSKPTEAVASHLVQTLAKNPFVQQYISQDVV